MGKNQYHDQPFTPGTVDEQIEQLLYYQDHQQDQQQSQTRTNGRVVRDLHTLYEQDADLLARVRERFVSSITESNHIQKPVVLQQDQSRRLHLAEQPHASFSSRSASRRRFTVLAAGLVAAFIIGSMLAVFTFVRPLGTQIASSQPLQTPVGLYTGNGDRVYRIDQRSGKIIWQYHLQDDRKADFGAHPPRVIILNTGPDNTVYAVSDSTVYAIDATRGTLHWSNTLFKLVLVASKPIVLGNRVYIPINDRVYALNTANGKLLATYSVGPTVEPKLTPVVSGDGGVRYQEGSEGAHDEMMRNAIQATVNNNTLYIVRLTTLYALSLPDGKQLWHRQVDRDQQLSMPQVVDGRVYVSSYNSAPKVTTSFIYAFNAQTGATVWQPNKITGRQVYEVTVDNGVIYANVLYKGVLAYDARTGKALWSTDDIDVRVGPTSAPQVDGSTVYITAESETSGHPAMIVGLDARSGSVKWTYLDNLPGTGIDIIVQNGVIYVVENEGEIYALKEDGKTILWRNRPGDKATGLTVVAVP